MVFKQQQSTYEKRMLIPSGQFGMISLMVLKVREPFCGCCEREVCLRVMLNGWTVRMCIVQVQLDMVFL